MKRSLKRQNSRTIHQFRSVQRTLLQFAIRNWRFQPKSSFCQSFEQAPTCKEQEARSKILFRAINISKSLSVIRRKSSGNSTPNSCKARCLSLAGSGCEWQLVAVRARNAFGDAPELVAQAPQMHWKLWIKTIRTQRIRGLSDSEIQRLEANQTTSIL